MKKNKIAFQGIQGAYSHEALIEFGKKKNIAVNPVESFNFDELFKNIKKVGLGFVPIENSNAGTVIQVIDLFLDQDIEIIGEYYFAVNHCLLGKKGTKVKDLKRIYSHPQALMQCSSFLDKNHIKAIPFADTAGSAKYIKEKGTKEEAAIGSENLAEIYGLKVIGRKIQNSEDNVTRFFLVKKHGKRFSFEKRLKNGSKKTKTSLIFCARDLPGALYKTLGGFATNGINLTKIESRPSQEKNFTYFFYIDFEGNPSDKAVANSLEELKFYSKTMKILGSYPVGKS